LDVNGQMRVREYLSLTVSFDHNMIDGAPAARFTERLKQLIESGYGLQDAANSAMDKGVGGRPGVVAATR
jgi:2-oxoacid dehydrogenase/acyltransferase catalytic subunit